MVMAKDCNLLLLDEPTNHLDLPAREALEEALRSYEGTLLFVSHDRYFVNGIADKIAELDGGSLTLYQGNYDDFANKKNVPKGASQTNCLSPHGKTACRTDKQGAEDKESGTGDSRSWKGNYKGCNRCLPTSKWCQTTKSFRR